MLIAPGIADPISEDRYNTMHSMGCMLLQEYTDHVKEIKSIEDLAAEINDVDYDYVSDEFDSLLRSLNAVGVKVF